MTAIGASTPAKLSPSRPADTLVSSQPLDSEAGRLARGLVCASDIPQDTVDQVAHDLTAIPPNWLGRLKDEHVAVVVMNSSQNLADTPLWPTFTPDKCEEMLARAGTVVGKAVGDFMAGFADIQDPEEKAYHLRMSGDELKSKLETLSNEEGLGFTVVVSREPKPFSVLAAEHGVNPDDVEQMAQWKSAFKRLNEGLLAAPSSEVEEARPEHGFYLIPYEIYKGKPFRALSLESLKSITGLDLSTHDGANYPENHFITIHENVAPDPSPHMGRHRVVLHETGHMIDWLTRAMPEVGPKHEKRVQELYEQAKAQHSHSRPEESPFLTPRAMDTPGEFFADGVEAFLTMPVGDQADHYKGDNNRLELEKRNPDLYSYLDWVLKL